jgi:hypothetical protein
LFLLIENRFVQLLEGEESAVLACMVRIEKDSRHKDVKCGVETNHSIQDLSRLVDALL